MMPMEVKRERTGWRDEEISRRHRLWGITCSATDVDFILIEWSKEKSTGPEPKALVEYKNEHAAGHSLKEYPQYIVYRKIATRCNIAFFVVRYSSDFSTFWVFPCNEKACEYLPKEKKLTEPEFVTLLYRVRDKSPVPPEVLEKINNTGIKLCTEQLSLGM